MFVFLGDRYKKLFFYSGLLKVQVRPYWTDLHHIKKIFNFQKTYSWYCIIIIRTKIPTYSISYSFNGILIHEQASLYTSDPRHYISTYYYPGARCWWLAVVPRASRPPWVPAGPELTSFSWSDSAALAASSQLSAWRRWPGTGMTKKLSRYTKVGTRVIVHAFCAD